MTEVFKTKPLLVPKVWGGSRLATLFGKVLPTLETYGESWEVADLPEGQSVVASGHDEGKTLQEVAELYGEDLVGTAAPDERFPLLVKLLDASAELSVQVHPGPEDAASIPDASSKDEFWYILDAAHGAAILHGLERTVDREVFLDAVATGTVARLMHRVEVAPGDVFRVPPGTIHAICSGVVLLEIQQPSDTTYRVYDYDRPGMDGQPRPLHLREAMKVANLGPSLPEERGLGQSTGPMLIGARVLANVDAYRIEKMQANEDVSWSVSPHTPQILHGLRGRFRLNDVTVEPGETVIIPAAQGSVWATDVDECEFVVAGLGGPALLAP